MGGNKLKTLRFEMRRMLNSPSMITAYLASLILVFIDVFYQLNLYTNGINHISVFYKWIAVNSYTFGGTYLLMSIPLLSAFGYSYTVSTDISSGYINQILTRTSRKRYFSAKLIAVFISGGIIFSAAIFIDFLLLSLFSPTIIPVPGDLNSFMNPYSFASKLFYTQPYLFVVVCILSSFLWGGAMSAMAATIGLFVHKKFISLIFPFAVFMAQSIIGGYIMSKQLLLIKGQLLELTWFDMLSTSLGTRNPTDWVYVNIIIAACIPIIIYYIRGNKYECI